MARAVLIQSLELLLGLHVVQELKHFGHPLLLSQAHHQGAVLGREPVPTWDAGAADGFTHYPSHGSSLMVSSGLTIRIGGF